MSLLIKSKIASFEQVNVMSSRVGLNKAASHGACHCISLNWLSLILRNPGQAAKERMTELSRGDGKQNAILQLAFGNRWASDPEGMDTADQLPLQNYRLKSNTVIPYQTFNPASVKGKFGGAGQGFVYSFWFDFVVAVQGASGGAHSIAFYVNAHGGSLTANVFDPNFGEFLVTGDEFLPLFAELMGQYGTGKAHRMAQITA
ncbi:MAG: YopT-type cysteine protease domain-containing protein [Moraxellaceae bacterium]|nr:YopT-type cysteine protease domain-containing protein [Moraxellaceae bacterium]